MSKPELDPKVEYPKMLYRKGIENASDVWGYKMQQAVVDDFDAKVAALKEGWKEYPNQVIAQYERQEKLLKPWNFYKANWQWFWGIVVAIVLAVFF